MRKLLLLILCILPVLCYSQVVRTSINYSPYTTAVTCEDYYAQSIWKLNNNGTDTKGNNNVTMEGGTTYSTTTPAEGIYNANLDGANRYIGVPSFTYGNEFTISIFVRKYGAGGSNDMIYCSYQSNDGFELSINWSTLATSTLKLRTGNGTNTTTATSSSFSVTSGAWHMYSAVINRTNGTVAFYNNKTAVGTGSTRTDFKTYGAARLGLDFSSNNDIFAGIDVTQVYKWELSSTNIGTIYDTPGAEATSCISTTPYTDDFEALSTGSINNQGLWKTIDGTVNIADVSGDNVTRGGTSGYNAALYDKTFTDDQYAKITAMITDYASPGPVVRANIGTGGTYYGWFHELSNATRLVRVKNGTATVLVNGTVGWTDNDVIELRIVGYELQCYKNGSLDTSVSGDGKYEDTSGDKIAGGQTGIMHYYQDNDAQAKQWEGGSL